MIISEMIISFNKVDKMKTYISTCRQILKSYDKIIVVKKGGKIYLNADYYNYNTTTARHRNLFLGVNSKQFNKNLKEGRYILVSDEEIIRLMRKWTFKNYVIYEETNVLRFEDIHGNILGYVTKNGTAEIEALNNGANPIAEDWEDGNGNTLTLDGWGFVAEREG